jgi:predicted Zn-dependent protease with MMP-like domain
LRREQFEEIVERAYEEIPEKFKQKMENIVITV